jgi:hypothetical protein
MNDIDVNDKDALCLLLRSKTPLGRLVDAEVHTVLDFLESIGFGRPAAAADVPAIEPEPETIAPPPGEPAPDADPATVIAPPPA